MCGLIGYSSKENFDFDKIKILYLYNSLARNSNDAAGIYTPLNGLAKDTNKGAVFIKGIEDIVSPDNLLIGHVRLKTVGDNRKINAHPFEKGNCVLAHNGTLKNHWALCGKRSISIGPINVDSEAIAECISKDDNLSVLSEIEGAAAFIIHDKRRPNRLIIFRNKERELYKGYIGASMYISSESEALEFINCINIKIFEEDHIYVIEDGAEVSRKKIINTPYKTIYTGASNTAETKFETEINKRATECFLRSKVSMTVNFGGSDKVHLKLNQYYKCVGGKGDLLIMDCENNGKTHSLSRAYFNMDDILTKGCYARLRYNIVRTSDDARAFDKDDIVRINSVNNKEHYVSVYSRFLKEKIDVSKKHLIKLTSEELTEYEASFAVPKNNTPILVGPVQNNGKLLENLLKGAVDFEVVEEDVDLEEYKFMINSNTESVLKDFFSHMNNLLDYTDEQSSDGIMTTQGIKSLKEAIRLNMLTFKQLFKKEDAGE